MGKNNFKITKADIEKIVKEVSKVLGREIKSDEFNVTVQNLSHTQPNKKDISEGRTGVYIFYNNEGVFKVGKVGKKSAIRWSNMHYNKNGNVSTFAKSLVEKEVVGKNWSNQKIKSYILNNYGRINIVFNNTCPPFTNALIESALHYRFKPKYEKTNK